MSIHAENNVRHDWTRDEIAALFEMPFGDLMFEAQRVHRMYFTPNAIQVSTLCSIKTGGCAEDCSYCSQSAHYDTPVKATKILDIEPVLEAARQAKASGATRFCMGAAWRSPKGRDMEKVTSMIREVKAMGLETCATLGMLTPDQASALKEAGLDYYNHNLDTSPEYYTQVITTRTYQDRLDTLEHVRAAGMKTCSGGIVGMGEKRSDRVGLLHALATLPAHPESVPINMLMKIDGTPLEGIAALEPLEFVRTIAVARILMPRSYVRLSAGRESMSDEQQAMCFMAGANSIFYGETLLTASNPEEARDKALFATLGLVAETMSNHTTTVSNAA